MLRWCKGCLGCMSILFTPAMPRVPIFTACTNGWRSLHGEKLPLAFAMPPDIRDEFYAATVFLFVAEVDILAPISTTVHCTDATPLRGAA